MYGITECLLLHTGQYTNVTTCEGKVSSPVEIDCQFNSTLNQSIVPSSSSFLWWKDGNMLNNISKTMIVDPFTPGDAGNYRCEVHYHDHVTFCGQVQLKVGKYLLISLAIPV